MLLKTYNINNFLFAENLFRFCIQNLKESGIQYQIELMCLTMS